MAAYVRTNMGCVVLREKPILMSGPMVQAILEGRKTQTRRVVKPQPEIRADGKVLRWNNGNSFGSVAGFALDQSRHGQPGDRLWVKETFYTHDKHEPNFTGFYRATDAERDVKWKPSIFMPRRFSRLTLEITAVRVERLQSISAADCVAEGIPGDPFSPAEVRQAYQELWESINGPGSWDLNPWVWCISFRRINAS